MLSPTLGGAGSKAETQVALQTHAAPPVREHHTAVYFSACTPGTAAAITPSSLSTRCGTAASLGGASHPPPRCCGHGFLLPSAVPAPGRAAPSAVGAAPAPSQRPREGRSRPGSGPVLRQEPHLPDRPWG